MTELADLMARLRALRAALGEEVYADALKRARVAVARAALDAAREKAPARRARVVPFADRRDRRR